MAAPPVVGCRDSAVVIRRWAVCCQHAVPAEVIQHDERGPLMRLQDSVSDEARGLRGGELVAVGHGVECVEGLAAHVVVGVVKEREEYFSCLLGSGGEQVADVDRCCVTVVFITAAAKGVQDAGGLVGVGCGHVT